MKVVLPRAGSYVVAVSGGVDSVVLLHRLQQEEGLKLVVAHFDHGIRTEALEDRLLVQQLAEKYELPFVYAEGRLGPGTSEAEARTARYRFLRRVQEASGARAIITAHHQDDLLETAIINIVRGSGRKGLTALGSREGLVRPLLHLPKARLMAYAKSHDLVWHEDSTNRESQYLRNYVRHNIMPRFDTKSRRQLVKLLSDLQTINQELDTLLVNQLHFQSVGGRLDRAWFNQLPHAVAREVLATWLRAHQLGGFDRRTLERLVVAAKTAPAGRRFPVQSDRYLQILKTNLALAGPER